MSEHQNALVRDDESSRGEGASLDELPRSPRELVPGASPGATLLIVVALFLFLRITIAAVRGVFFDELFTRWIAGFDFAGILERLRSDSGPPLYYLIVSILPSPPEVLTVRMLSIALSAVGFVAVLLLVRDRELRLTVAVLLATWPLHVAMSTDARAYALLASATGVATLALWRWVRESARLWIGLAIAALSIAIWTHWYGFVFAPLPLVAAILSRRRWAVGEALLAMVLLTLASLPAVQLLRSQPAEASSWMAEGAGGSVIRAAVTMAMSLSPAPLTHHPVAPPYLSSWTSWSSLLAFAIIAAVVARASRRSVDVKILALLMLVPIAGVLVLIASGRPAYFPGRFEVALAVPFVLLVAAAAREQTKRWRNLLIGGWIILAVSVWGFWVVQMPREPEDPWRLVAMFAREAVEPGETIIASGPMYLELLGQSGEEWQPRIATFPAEQAEHPGWRARADLHTLELEVMALPPEGWWAGEPGSAEFRVLSERFAVEPQFSAGPVGLARISVRRSE